MAKKRKHIHGWSGFWSGCRAVFAIWKESNCARLGAAVAYYTTFSVIPIFIIALAIAGVWLEKTQARENLLNQISGLVGPESAKAVGEVAKASEDRHANGVWAQTLAVLTLLFGATGAFVELQDSLNTIWQVERKPQSGILQFIRDRLLSFAMVIGMGFLLLVSLVISAGLSTLSTLVLGDISDQSPWWNAVNFVVSLGIITCLFAVMFKLLPDAKIAWHDVWIGALLTAALFNLGKFLLGFYLGHSSITDSYGAGGSLVIVLLWVYYSAQIVFIGAAFTRYYADHFGSRIRAGSHARLVKAS